MEWNYFIGKCQILWASTRVLAMVKKQITQIAQPYSSQHRLQFTAAKNSIVSK